MNIQQCLSLASLRLESVQTYLGRMQVCDVTSCQVSSRSLFVLDSRQDNIKICVCSDCASRLTGLKTSELSIVDKYLEKVKPHLKSLKSLNGLQSINDPKRPYYVSQLSKIIGDQRIYIAILKNNQCTLIINYKQLFPNNSKSFNNPSVATKFAVEYVNNQYKKNCSTI